MYVMEGPTGYSLVFNVSTDEGYAVPLVFSTRTHINGSFGKSSYSQGLKKIRIEAKEDAEGNKYVWVSAKGKCAVNEDCGISEQCVGEECVLCTAPTCDFCYTPVHCICEVAPGCAVSEVLASEDDAFSYKSPVGTFTFYSQPYVCAGNLDADTMYGSGFRFTGLNVLKGEVIESAYLQLYQNILAATPLNISGEASDSAENFRDGASVFDRGKTENYVLWTTSLITNESVNTPDITGPVQEVISRPGWSDTLVVMILPQPSLEPNICFNSTWDNGYAARLVVKYS
jgi:hypothetical protein